MPDPDPHSARRAQPGDDRLREREAIHGQAGPLRDDDRLEPAQEDLRVDRLPVEALRHAQHVCADDVSVDQDGQRDRRPRRRASRAVDRLVDVGARAERLGRWTQAMAAVEDERQRLFELLLDERRRLFDGEPADRDAGDRDPGRDQRRQWSRRRSAGRGRPRRRPRGQEAGGADPATEVSAPAAAQASARAA
jgi:hypothetical protein